MRSARISRYSDSTTWPERTPSPPKSCSAAALRRRAEAIGMGNAAVGATQAGERMRRDHINAIDNLEGRPASAADESRDAGRSRHFAGARKQHVEVGDAAVRDPGLIAAEHV